VPPFPKPDVIRAPSEPFQPVERVFRFLQHEFALRRQAQTPLPPVEQGKSQVILQCADMPAHRRLRHFEQFGSAHRGAGLGDRAEHLDPSKIK
jgi:hypothetical protein